MHGAVGAPQNSQKVFWYVRTEEAACGRQEQRVLRGVVSDTDKWLHGELSHLHMYKFREPAGKTKTPDKYHTGYSHWNSTATYQIQFRPLTPILSTTACTLASLVGPSSVPRPLKETLHTLSNVRHSICLTPFYLGHFSLFSANTILCPQVTIG